jgi:hypothetical protein
MVAVDDEPGFQRSALFAIYRVRMLGVGFSVCTAILLVGCVLDQLNVFTSDSGERLMHRLAGWNVDGAYILTLVLMTAAGCLAFFLASLLISARERRARLFGSETDVESEAQSNGQQK